MKRIYLILVLLLSITSVFSQNNSTNGKKQPPKPRSSTYCDFNLTMGIPMYMFSDVSSSLPFGFSLNVLHQPRSYVPILFGGGITYLNAGGNRLTRTLTADITAGNVLIDQIVMPLEFRINNNIINGHAMVRFQGPWKVVKPYIDLTGGFNYLWTTTAVYDLSDERYFAANNNNDDGLITRKTQVNDITWAAGFGAGMYIRLNPAMYLNLNAHYMGAGWAQYYDRNQIKDWDIQLNVSGVGANPESGAFQSDDLSLSGIPKNSRTDMLYAQLGLGFSLGHRGNASKTKQPKSQGVPTPKPKPPYRR
jgi:hypothetical protein